MSPVAAEIASLFVSVHIQIAIVSVICLLLLTHWWRSGKGNAKRFLIPNPPKDTVVLHQYGKGSTVPSISPFVMKLETYLKVAKIPYINKYSRRPGPKGKLPWIQYNDHVIADSQFCIEFLNRERGVNLNKHLRPDQLAIGHLVRRTVEESTYWSMITWRLLLEKTGLVYRKLGLPSAVVWYLRRAARSGLLSQGIGRHSEQEVTHLLEDDLEAVSQILGDRHFLFGQKVSDVTEFDCALFGQLCQLVWQMPGTPIEQNIAEKTPNLVAFCERMKAAFWPEWDDRILHPSLSTKAVNGQENAHQISPFVTDVASEKTAASVVMSSPVRRLTSFTTENTFSTRNGVTTRSNAFLTKSNGKENIINTLNNRKSISKDSQSQVSQNNQPDVNNTTSQTNQTTTSSILVNKPSFCSSQQYYHDLVTF